MSKKTLLAPDSQLIAQLSAPAASLPPKLFYDVLGSTLFTAICQVPEYYQTRTEQAIFERFGPEIALQLTRPFRLVDLGAGDCRKAARLIPVLEPAAYTPIDISGDFLEASASALRASFPGLSIDPLVADFTAPWTMPAGIAADRPVFFYPGSSIGNFTPEHAVQFLAGLRNVGTHTDCALIIGIDTVKSSIVLEAAYDDALGVTAAFNRNTLLNANRQLGTDFDVSQWDHRSTFNATESRIEMHLVAKQALTVTWQGGERSFAIGETIHTENSYKYTRESFAQLLADAGFSVVQTWLDDEDQFMVVLAKA